MALWTQEEISVAQAMHNDGEEYAKIARKLGRNVNSVKKKLAHLRRPPAPPREATWTPAQDATIRSMRAAGMTFQSIAATLGRSHKTVEGRARAIGVPRRGNADRVARAVANQAAMRARVASAPDKPCVYDAKTAKWALGNWKTNEEARLVAVHLGLSGDKRGRAVIQALRAAMAMQAAA